MSIPQTKSITEVFVAVKKKTGHKADKLDSEYYRGWLVFSTRCFYCAALIELYTENNAIAVNRMICGDFRTNRIRLNPKISELALCRRLAVMK